MDLNNISTRHIGAQEIILYMAAYAPAFGMLGTVLGLIIMMNKFQMSGETSSIDFNVFPLKLSQYPRCAIFHMLYILHIQHIWY